jgi:NADPH2:quinone reductase
MLKGLTASNIVNRVFRPKASDTILIHAAASGVGLLLVQWSKHLGATVIGTAGNANKARIAEAHGCDHTILYREIDFVAATKRIAPAGVTAVFDGVGKDTFIKSFDCTAPFGDVSKLWKCVGSRTADRRIAAIAQGVSIHLPNGD